MGLVRHFDHLEDFESAIGNSDPWAKAARLQLQCGNKTADRILTTVGTFDESGVFAAIPTSSVRISQHPVYFDLHFQVETSY
jgi:hypothetical protein